MKSKADMLRQIVYDRTRIAPQELACPRERSDMTPCIVRDGQLAVADGAVEVCVGCGAKAQDLLDEESTR